MRTFIRILLILLVLGGIATAAYFPASSYWKKRNAPKWRFDEVKKGQILAVVNSTGTVKPVLEVHVGAVVSGPVKELWADFNDEVEKDQVLAQIDTRLYDASVRRDEATLKSRKADQKRVTVLLGQAENDQRRAEELQKENKDFISEAELDQIRFGLLSLKAQLEVAEASVETAQANLENSEANLKYTEITSPVDGMIIDRKIDKGQALASQFQAPELFIVAPDMRETMHVFASVDETDIGLIRQAQKQGQPVHFTVDAYPDDLFEGVIEEIRFSSVQVQNVVTYPVVVAAPNPELKLLPGMTANISFRVDERQDVLKVPNAALRFYPQEKHVREEDRKLLQGATWEKKDDDEPDVELSAEEKAKLRREHNRRHVWIVDGEFLRAVEVVVDLTDSKYAEMVSGELKEGQKLVTGIEPKK